MIRASTPDLSAIVSDSTFTSDSPPSTSSGSGSYHPLSFRCTGKNGGAYTLYASTPEERNTWRRALREAIGARRANLAAASVFDAETITSDTAMSQHAPAGPPGLVTGRIACSLPFGESITCTRASARNGTDITTGGKLVMTGEGLWLLGARMGFGLESRGTQSVSSFRSRLWNVC